MKRAAFLGLLSFILILGGLFSFSRAILILSIPIWIYIGVGLLFSPRPLQLTATRAIDITRVSPKEPVTVITTILNNGSSIEEVIFEDLIPDRIEILEGPKKAITSLKTGETFIVEHILKAKRGEYYFPKIKASATDHFGLFHQKSTLPAPASLLVFPPAIPLKRAAIRPRRTRVYSGQIPARQGGAGVEFFGTRPYEKGDPLRWIDWKSSARYEDTFITKVFEQERVADVGLILDARLQSDTKIGDHSLFEHSIEATAALSNTFIGLGNRVGMMIYGKVIHWTFPGFGKLQRERILQTLARVEQGRSPVFKNLDHIPTKLFPNGSQLILISPLKMRDVNIIRRLRGNGFQVMVISPNPGKFALNLLPDSKELQLAYQISRIERMMMIRKMRQAGIQVLDWDVKLPFKEAAHALLSRPPAYIQAVGAE